MDMITISLTLPADKVLPVYAFLGGAGLVAGTGKAPVVEAPTAPVSVVAPVAPEPVVEAPTAPVSVVAPVAPEPVVEAPTDIPPPPPVADTEAKVDSAGAAFDETIHTGTVKKDGTWRLKKGAVPSDTPAAPPLPPVPVVEEDDEFAAFASVPAAPAAPVARKWSDADLSKLCNQGASKDGNPDRVKAIIADYVPEGEVQHSRNIPVDDREAFAQEIEATLEIQYAG